MFWGNILEVRTPWGPFELGLADLGREDPQPGSRIATAEEADQAWFFFSANLEFPIWSEVGPVLALYAQLTGVRVKLTGEPEDLRTMQEVVRCLQGALARGQLQFRAPPPRPAPQRRERVPAGLPELPLLAQAQPPRALSTYEVVLVDELNEPVSGIPVLFSWSGRTEERVTDGAGLATCTVPECGAAVVSVAERELLTQALKARWEVVRGVPREHWVTPDANTTVVPYRTGEPLGTLSVGPGTRHRASYQPYLFVVRLWGAFFDSDKCFLLPTAIPHVQHLKEIYSANGETKLLSVGHADPTGDTTSSDALSLERAEALVAYLRDDVERWHDWYDDSKPLAKRWGRGEDGLMIKSLAGFTSKPAGEDSIAWYQRARGYTADGSLTVEQRKALIREYLTFDGTTLPASVEPLAHGCGESFPVEQLPLETEAAWDRHSSVENRRVELFFFDGGMGVQPPPPGPLSGVEGQEYPEWVRRQLEQYDLTIEERAREVVLLEMHDALFRSNSAVVLPEGEDPTGDSEGHLSLSSVGMIATVLRYNEEHPEKRLLVAGHCDTTNTVDFNQKLSEERAGVAHSLLVGNREQFVELCQGRHDEVDVTQIFDWAARAYGFSCKPTRLDAAPSDQRYQQFRDSYNRWLDERDPAEEPDPRGGSKISQWGRLDPTVWGAIFDVYEHNLREELGEDAAGVAALRDQIVWVDPERQALGFSEHHPVDNLGRDQYRSQANRRVEILFFAPGEEPDLAAAEADPAGSEIYLPGYYEKVHLPPLPGKRRNVLYVRLHDRTPQPLDVVSYWVTLSGTRTGPHQSSNGWAKVVLPENECSTILLEWGTPSEDSPDEYAHARRIVPTCGADEGEEEAAAQRQALARARLHNLGYDTLSESVADLSVELFQIDYGLDELGVNEDGTLPEETIDEITRIYTHECDGTPNLQ